jgi:hypothetical protein
MTYRIVRFYFHESLVGRPAIIQRGLSKTAAIAHCSDPETSSRTAVGAVARRRTKRLGPWFDGFEQEEHEHA